MLHNDDDDEVSSKQHSMMLKPVWLKIVRIRLAVVGGHERRKVSVDDCNNEVASLLLRQETGNVLQAFACFKHVSFGCIEDDPQPIPRLHSLEPKPEHTSLRQTSVKDLGTEGQRRKQDVEGLSRFDKQQCLLVHFFGGHGNGSQVFQTRITQH